MPIDKDKHKRETSEKSVSGDSKNKLKESDLALPELPQQITEPCARFFSHHTELWNLIVFMIQQWRNAALDLTTIIRKSDPSSTPKPEAFQRIKQQALTVEGLLAHFDLMLHLAFCGVVDNYLSYVSELLALIYRTKPEMLRSSETETLNEILRYSTMEELTNYLAEKRVNRLSYRGMSELSEYLSQELGFCLFEKPDDLSRAVLIVETRNLIVHNRAIIDSRFLRRVPDFSGKIGDTIDLGGSKKSGRTLKDIQFLARSVADVDPRACVKFDLPRPICAQDPKLSRDLK
jgi:hypothetical protein